MILKSFEIKKINQNRQGQKWTTSQLYKEWNQKVISHYSFHNLLTFSRKNLQATLTRETEMAAHALR